MIKHRSQLSHGPIIGTALRVAYLAGWLSLFAIAIILFLNVLWDAQLTWQTLKEPFQILFRTHLFEWLAIVVGLELGSISHSLSDAFGTQIARRKQKKRRKPRSNR